jgi:hypothetical protein
MLASAGSGVALAGALVGAGAVSAAPTRPPGQPLLEWIERYALVLNFRGSDSLRTATGNAAPTGPGYWTGALYADGDVGTDGAPVAGARQLGTYRASVWVYVPGVAPQFTAIHSIDIAGRGQISASGVSDISVAITGGTGEFQGVRGEIRAANLGTTGAAITLEIEAIAPTPGR